MPGSKRERELERRRLERQAQRRAARRQRQRQRSAIAGSVVAVLAVIGAIVYLYGPGGGGGTATAISSPSAPASGAPSAGASASPAAAGTCSYTKAGTAAKNVGTPPTTPTQKTGTETATIVTNRGTIVASLLAGKAPCTVNSFAYLASKGYFASTPCHRLTTSGIYVLQCGDPTGTGGGGPGYKFGEENLGAFGSGQSVTYPAGTLAMANAGAGTNGSQFFLVYKDSPLPPSYTPFGTITSGLDVVQGIAKAGVEGGGGDGKPKEAVNITSVTVRPAATTSSSQAPAATTPPPPPPTMSATATPSTATPSTAAPKTTPPAVTPSPTRRSRA